MKDYTIEMNNIEELQTIKDVRGLEKIFSSAKTAIVNGAEVVLVRKEKSGVVNKFDAIDNLEDLENFRSRTFRYL